MWKRGWRRAGEGRGKYKGEENEKGQSLSMGCRLRDKRKWEKSLLILPCSQSCALLLFLLIYLSYPSTIHCKNMWLVKNKVLGIFRFSSRGFMDSFWIAVAIVFICPTGNYILGRHSTILNAILCLKIGLLFTGRACYWKLLSDHRKNSSLIQG